MNKITVHMDEYRPLREVVFSTLREAILKGELAPGERLMEMTLAERLGVSRTPIREAMRKLEQEGLVVMIPRRGVQVASITQKDLTDVLEVRQVLEELAIKKALDSIVNQEMIALNEAAERFAREAEGEELVRIAEADEAFHAIIYKAAGNVRLVQVLQNMREQMYRYRIVCLKEKTVREQLAREHEMIIEALLEKNEERAISLTRQHIENQKQIIIQTILSEGDK